MSCHDVCRRLENIIKMNQRVEGVNEKLALNPNNVNISKEINFKKYMSIDHV